MVRFTLSGFYACSWVWCGFACYFSEMYVVFVSKTELVSASVSVSSTKSPAARDIWLPLCSWQVGGVHIAVRDHIRLDCREDLPYRGTCIFPWQESNNCARDERCNVARRLRQASLLWCDFRLSRVKSHKACWCHGLKVSSEIQAVRYMTRCMHHK